MLDKPYAQQTVAGIIILAGCAFLIFLGWLTAEQRHGLTGIILWAFCYGLPVVVLALWCRPYVAALARGISVAGAKDGSLGFERF